MRIQHLDLAVAIYVTLTFFNYLNNESPNEYEFSDKIEGLDFLCKRSTCIVEQLK